MAKRPLIHTEPVSEFGASMPESGNDSAPIDLLYVPGASDLRVQRDGEMAEYAEGTRHGKDVMVLPGNVRWVAITTGPSNTPSSLKLMRSANNGYKPVTKDMLPDSKTGAVKHAFLTGLPPGARVLPDGTIINAAGDLQLHYCDAATAARNQARKARAALQQIDNVGGNLGNGAEGLNGRRYGGLEDAKEFGAEISVERSTKP